MPNPGSRIHTAVYTGSSVPMCHRFCLLFSPSTFRKPPRPTPLLALSVMGATFFFLNGGGGGGVSYPDSYPDGVLYSLLSQLGTLLYGCLVEDQGSREKKTALDYHKFNSVPVPSAPLPSCNSAALLKGMAVCLLSMNKHE